MSAEPRHTNQPKPTSRPRLKAVPGERPVSARSRHRGSSAQKIPAGRTGAKNRVRRPLSTGSAARPASKRRYVIFVLVSILIALSGILLLNVQITERQYQLVQLRSQETALLQENERLAQEIEFNQAPQNLAVRAVQLGMVAATQQATLNVQTGEVSGVPYAVTPVETDSDVPTYTKNMIDPPALYDTDAYQKASERAKEQQRREAEAKKEREKKAAAKESARATPTPTASAGE
ncbi:hypothetical protein [Rothia sp. ZJ932]|uniref:hypothetical protein n=1 Tax=Rothia sp. ZJ932 TaxID=2810516 RepID=UPI0019685751|nr:hypothetical protein [Rothia sp. ZJ932]QRZ60942.1 hypothetical protein JR346_06635 [Rothia sp. ZJ932]